MPKAIIKFTSLIKPLPHLKMMHLEVSKKTLIELGGLTKQRYICTVNKKVSWHCGLVALKTGKAYISLNKKILKEINAGPRDSVEVVLKKDASKYGMEISDELKTLLRQDEEGSRRFHLLSAGKQRFIIYYVSQVKNTQSRIDRAIRLIENLKKTSEGKETFKEVIGAGQAWW